MKPFEENEEPEIDESEVDLQFKTQVAAKVITMSVLFITIVTINFRVQAINQFIKQVDYYILAVLIFIIIGFFLVGLWKRSLKTGFMLGRWGLPLIYTLVSLLLVTKF